MAISFKADKDYGYSLLPLFGVSAQVIANAKKAGVTVDQSNPGTFVVKYNDFTYGSITVKGSAISLAKSHTLGPASKEALRYQFEAAIDKALAAAAKLDPVTPAQEDNVFDGSDSYEIPTVKKSSAIKNMLKGLSPTIPKSSAATFSKSNAVELTNATHVYEPTKGTTAGSIYYVLAILDGVKISARVLGQKLSLRAEGPKLGFYQGALEDMGMDMKKGYSSGHYDVPNTGLMIKTLGAMVGRMGFGAVKEMADIKAFIEGQQ